MPYIYVYGISQNCNLKSLNNSQHLVAMGNNLVSFIMILYYTLTMTNILREYMHQTHSQDLQKGSQTFHIIWCPLSHDSHVNLAACSKRLKLCLLCEPQEFRPADFHLQFLHTTAQ